MEKKNFSGLFWFISSVFFVAFPAILPVIMDTIIYKKQFDLENISGNIILLLFSISISLFFLCLNLYEQKKGIKIMIILIGTMFISVFSFVFYIISLFSKTFKLTDNVCIFLILLIISISIIGIILGYIGDKNHNDTIEKMHNNCSKIRNTFISPGINDSLEIIAVNEYDLLCSPKQFKRTELAIKKHLREKGGK